MKHCLVLLFLSGIIFSSGGLAQDECDLECGSCQCTRAGESTFDLSIECIDYAYETLPDCLMENVTSLNVIGSSLVKLFEADFQKTPRLKYLTVNNSPNLTEIEANAFGGLKELETLQFSSIGEIELTDGMFTELHNLTTIQITDSAIATVSPHIFVNLSSLIKLDLYHNGITDLNSQFLTGCDKLENLDLSGNMLTDIAGETFKGTASLQMIILSGNTISGIIDGAFDEAVSLEELDLSYNLITALSVNLWKTPQPYLQRLRLRGNLLQAVPTQALQNLPALGSLELNANSITEIPADAFANLTTLHGLDLNDNNVVLKKNAFRGLDELKRLQLSDNKLDLLNPEAINPQDLPAIEEIMVFNNSFRALDDIFREFGSLTRVEAYGNPYYCDCGVAWMKLAMDNKADVWAHNWKEEISAVRCQSPQTFSGVPIDQIGIYDLTCEPPLLDEYNSYYNKYPNRVDVVMQAMLTRGAPSARWYTPSGKVITPLNPDNPPSGKDRKVATQEIGPDFKVTVTLLIVDATEASNGGYTLEGSNTAGDYNISRFEIQVPKIKKGLTPGEIVAIVVAICVIFIIVALLVVVFRFYRMRAAYSNMTDDGQGGYDDVTPGAEERGPHQMADPAAPPRTYGATDSGTHGSVNRDNAESSGAEQA